LITFRIEVTVEDYILDDWCDQQSVNPDDLDGQEMAQFVDDHFGLWADNVEML